MPVNQIAIIGLGHVGLPTALSFAAAGWKVLGTDSVPDRVAEIAAGRTPFFEPGLDPLLHEQLASGRFAVTASLEEAVRASEVLFICVGTPPRPDGGAELSQVEAVARTIAANLNGYKLIVEKSTTPVRTAERVRQTVARYQNGHYDFDIAVNPEFLQEGHAVHDVLHPDRVVLGVDTDRARELLSAIYAPLLDRIPPATACDECARRGAGGTRVGRLLVTGPTTAELIKHSANAFLAMKISFINMVAELCETTGADVEQVARGIGLDPRIGPRFLQAGLGYGGSCLPKDVQAFIRIAEEHRVDFGLLKEVTAVNRRQVDRLFDKLQQALWVVAGKTVAVLGLAFKPLTDDIRDAPSQPVVHRLVDQGAAVRLYDPQAMANFRQIVPAAPGRVTYCNDAYEAASGAHALIVLTEWAEFCALDLTRLRDAMAVPVMIDGRNVFEPAAVRAAGFEYASFGRP